MSDKWSICFLGAVGLLTVACGDSPIGPPPFDSTQENLNIKGNFFGFEFDILTTDEIAIFAEREYRGPHEPDTDPADEIPDFSESTLCSIEAAVGTATIDGQEWVVELEVENFIPSAFGVGRYEVIGPEEPRELGKVTAEFQMENQAASFEKTAINGNVEIIVYENTATHVDNEDILEGGFIGGTFVLEFGPNEVLRGAFYSEFIVVDVQGEAC